MNGAKELLSDAWRLAAPYYRSNERWFARLLLASIVGLSLFLVAMNVVLSYWNRAFFDSLQNKDQEAFVNLLLFYRSGEAGFMPGFVWIAAVYIPVAIYRTYLNQWLQIRWRRWMTEHLLRDWLSDRAYYTISLTTDPGNSGTDNPDQRIAEDLKGFVDDTLRLGLGLMSNVVTLLNFAFILWSLSGVLNLFGIPIPGFMLWAAVIYAVVGSWLTHLVGRPLVPLNFQQQKAEADFRYSLVRLRDNTEGVALYAGEAEEQRILHGRFGAVASNWYQIMRRNKLLNALIAGYEQLAAIFPIVVASPRYFSGAITLGGLTQTSGAFARVQGALSWFIEAYASLADWRATVIRLTTFRRAVDAAKALATQTAAVQASAGDAVGLRGVTLSLPDGTRLLEHGTLEFPRGRSTVISGRSGTGKSTLFRALAGIWPFATGAIERPPGTYLFLPQRPYIPLGTLRHAVTYPAPEHSFSDADVRQALAGAGLPALAGALDEDQPWSQRLSGGEQQRLAIARALLLRPDWLFMDEATASLDPEAEAELYGALRRELPDTTIISIAHRPAVAAFHDEARVFRRIPGQPGTLENVAPTHAVSPAE